MLEQVRVSRRIVVIRIEMHGFCASERACLYLRSVGRENERRCRLICAKSRVMPVKKISLPRLELCGALLLTRLMNKVVGAIALRIDERHWCDSTVYSGLILWISKESSHWKTFIANRIAEIHETSLRSQWHHVFEENPTDILSCR
ncbi:uncharacterized protein [Temnothorax nylanderi]|uniref:uncharacterized protein n=1 Tax=Temnothorax nylanderi TaxID=102681 RepID=UPI003A87F6C3